MAEAMKYENEGAACTRDMIQTIHDNAMKMCERADAEDYIKHSSFYINSIEFHYDMLLNDLQSFIAIPSTEQEQTEAHDSITHVNHTLTNVYMRIVENYDNMMGQVRPRSYVCPETRRIPQIQQLEVLVEKSYLLSYLCDSSVSSIDQMIETQMRIIHKSMELFRICKDSVIQCIEARTPLTFIPINPYDGHSYLFGAMEAVNDIFNIYIPKRNKLQAAAH
jgi:hypothetical protein